HAAAGALAVAQGQFDAARMAFEQALARRPDADDVRLDYADALDKLGRHADARREYERLAGGRETTEPIRREAQRRRRWQWGSLRSWDRWARWVGGSERQENGRDGRDGRSHPVSLRPTYPTYQAYLTHPAIIQQCSDPTGECCPALPPPPSSTTAHR